MLRITQGQLGLLSDSMHDRACRALAREIRAEAPDRYARTDDRQMHDLVAEAAAFAERHDLALPALRDRFVRHALLARPGLAAVMQDARAMAVLRTYEYGPDTKLALLDAPGRDLPAPDRPEPVAEWS